MTKMTQFLIGTRVSDGGAGGMTLGGNLSGRVAGLQGQDNAFSRRSRYSGGAAAHCPSRQVAAHQGMRHNSGAVIYGDARKNCAAYANWDVPPNVDRGHFRVRAFGRNGSARHPASAEIVRCAHDLAGVRCARVIAKTYSPSASEHDARVNVDCTAKAEEALACGDSAKAINPSVVVKVNVLNSDDYAILRDPHVLANCGKPEIAQFFGAVIPRIKRVFHPENMRLSGLPDKQNRMKAVS